MRFIKRIGMAAFGLALWASMSGCGPGLMLLGGGGSGGWLAFGGGGDDEKKSPTPTTPDPGPTNTAPLALVNSLTRTQSPSTLTFRLADAESDLIDVQIQYALVVDPTDSDFDDCTPAVGSETTGLTSSPGGTQHTFEWDYATDLGGQGAVTGITIRVLPNDGEVDGATGTLGDQYVGNSAPVIMNPQAVGAQLSGNVLLTYDLMDVNSDLVGFEVRVSSDEHIDEIVLSGTDFLGTDPIGLPGQLISSPTGTTGQVVWDSTKTFAFHTGNVTIRLIPKDLPNGFTQENIGDTVTIGPIQLVNISNRAPTLTVPTTPSGTFYGQVRTTVLLQDLDADSVYVHCEFSTDSGTSYSDCTMSAGFAYIGPFATLANQPLAYNITWNAIVDLQSLGQFVFDRCRLRLTVFDDDVGTEFISGQFELILAQAPNVTNVQVQGDDGNIPIVITLFDAASDPCTLAIDFRLTSAGAWIPLTQSDFLVGNLSTVTANAQGGGYANVFIWNTLLRAEFGTGVANQYTVQLRVVATDHPLNDDTGDVFDIELDSTPFITNEFPILNSQVNTDVTNVFISVDPPADPYTIDYTESCILSAVVTPTQVSPDDEVTWTILSFAPGAALTGANPSTTIQLDAPATPTEGVDYIVIEARSEQNPLVANTIVLFYGPVITGISVNPAGPVDLIEGYEMYFAATVTPIGATQYATWEVIPSDAGYFIFDGYFVAASPLPSPGVKNIVTIRARSWNPAIFDDVTVNLLPLPQGASISGPATVPVGSQADYDATVTPPDAPQLVFWGIYWANFYYGSGNDLCGHIDSNGLYTAPVQLPQPDQLYIVCGSYFNQSVVASFLITLTASPPTNFQITSPPPSSVYAGGQGKDFDAINFTPPDAPYVTWSLDSDVIAGDSIDPTTGYYTPPDDIGGNSVSVTIRATALYGGVQKTQSLTVLPKVLGSMPSSVTIEPNPSLIADDGPTSIDFLPLVNPASAPQGGTWSLTSGPTGGGVGWGNITNPQGVYSPPNNGSVYNRDTQITARFTCAPPSSSVIGNTSIAVAGRGFWSSHDTIAMGRNNPLALNDTARNRTWFIGGRSETVRVGEQDLQPWIHDGTGSGKWYPGPDAMFAFGSTPPARNALAAAIVPSLGGVGSQHIVAIVGDNNGYVRVASFNLANDPGITPQPQWQEVSTWHSGGGTIDDIPILSASGRYHLLTVTDATVQECWLLVGADIYRFSYVTNLWNPRILGVAGQPADPNVCGYFVSPGFGHHILIGPTSAGGSQTQTLRLVPGAGTPSWIDGSTGVGGPSPVLSECSIAVLPVSGKTLVFGGKQNLAYQNEVYTLTYNASGFITWSGPTVISSFRPSSRGDAAFTVVNANGTPTFIIYGGRGGPIGGSIFGDLWAYNESTGVYAPFNPPGVWPQARKNAAMAFSPFVNAIFMFGGVCQHGMSDETWRCNYDPVNGPTWTRYAFAPGPSVPPGLRGASMVWDNVANRMLLLWGSTEVSGATGFTNTLYAFNVGTNTWSSITVFGPAPVARGGAGMCFDSASNQLVSFGGVAENVAGGQLLGDMVWLSLSSTTWITPPAPTGGTPPPPAYGVVAGYDPGSYTKAAHRRYYFFGGNRTLTGELPSYEMYAWDVTDGRWISIVPTRPDNSRSPWDSAAAFDSSIWRRFLFAPRYERQGVGVIMGNTPDWQELEQGAFDYHLRSAMGCYDANGHRFFAIMGEGDVGGVGLTPLNAFRVLRLNG